jgi:hypothetical protein
LAEIHLSCRFLAVSNASVHVVAAVREKPAQGRRREAAAGCVLAEGRGHRRQGHPNKVSKLSNLLLTFVFFSAKNLHVIELLLLVRDGKSRQFAFIGYRTNEEADEALKYFNNTYIDTCKITCEVLIVFNIFSPWCCGISLVNCLH